MELVSYYGSCWLLEFSLLAILVAALIVYATANTKIVGHLVD